MTQARAESARLELLIGGEISVSFTAHPAGAGQVSLVCLSCSLRLEHRINLQNVPYDVVGIDASRSSVEQPEIGDEMQPIVIGDGVLGGRCVENRLSFAPRNCHSVSHVPRDQAVD